MLTYFRYTYMLYFILIRQEFFLCIEPCVTYVNRLLSTNLFCIEHFSVHFYTGNIKKDTNFYWYYNVLCKTENICMKYLIFEISGFILTFHEVQLPSKTWMNILSCCGGICFLIFLSILTAVISSITNNTILCLQQIVSALLSRLKEGSSCSLSVLCLRAFCILSRDKTDLEILTSEFTLDHLIRQAGLADYTAGCEDVAGLQGEEEGLSRSVDFQLWMCRCCLWGSNRLVGWRGRFVIVCRLSAVDVWMLFVWTWQACGVERKVCHGLWTFSSGCVDVVCEDLTGLWGGEEGLSWSVDFQLWIYGCCLCGPDRLVGWRGRFVTVCGLSALDV